MARKFGLAPIHDVEGMTTADHISLLKDVGFNGFFTRWDRDETAKRRQAADRCGITYQSIHAPYEGVDAVWREGEAGDLFINTLSDCLDDCKNNGIDIMVLHPYIGFNPPYIATDLGLDRFSRLVDRAVARGVSLAFENVEGEEYLAALMARFRTVPEVGFCLDTGHELCYNLGKDMLALYGDRLIHTHLNDNIGMTGEHIYWTDDLHLVPTDGKIDWQNLKERIDGTNYKGILMCELTLTNKPGKHTHDAYRAMKIEDFYAYALKKVRSAFGE